MKQFLKGLLSQTVNEVTGGVSLRDYQHASLIFRNNSYAYLPKNKYLFHVEFVLNKEYINSVDLFKNIEDNNFGLLVKSVSLPKFQIQQAELNQYNRPRVVQTKIKYDPVNIEFHDTNNNLINKLWYAYYTYHYADSLQRTISNSQNSGINNRNIYENDIADNMYWGYYGDPSSQKNSPYTDQIKVPFFHSIKIYGFASGTYTMYELMNPTIESFKHDDYDYSRTSDTMSNSMTVRYESVKYASGLLDSKDPSNTKTSDTEYMSTFGKDTQYDLAGSPNKPGSSANLLGDTGVIAGGLDAFEDLANGNYLGALIKGATTVRTVQRAGGIGELVKSEAKNIISNNIKAPNGTNVVQAYDNVAGRTTTTTPAGSAAASTNTAVTSTLNSVRTNRFIFPK